MAARINPISGRVVMLLSKIKICWSSHVLRLIANQAKAIIKPISPMRLYKIACKAAVLASVRPCHQPMRRNDMIPTPSHPINS